MTRLQIDNAADLIPTAARAIVASRLRTNAMSRALNPLRRTLCACLLIATVAHADSTPADPNAAFMQLADEFFDQYYFPTNPTTATLSGIHDYDGKLEDFSKAGIDRAIGRLEDFDRRVSAVDAKTLDEQTRGDRELVLNTIHGTLLTLQTIKPWQKNPDTYSSGITNSAFSIMERKFAPPADRLRMLIAREKLMPAVLQQARANLSHPPKIYTEIALEQLPGSTNFFAKDVPAAFAGVNDKALQAFTKVAK